MEICNYIFLYVNVLILLDVDKIVDIKKCKRFVVVCFISRGGRGDFFIYKNVLC